MGHNVACREYTRCSKGDCDCTAAEDCTGECKKEK